jgi:ATP-binding cassette subfamily F protein 3
VILVSHDRHLLEACADRLLLVADGRVTGFDGDLEDYRTLVLAERGSDGKENDGRAPARARRPDARRQAAQKRSELAPLRRRIAEAEAEIARLSADIKQIDAVLAQAQLFVREPAKAAAFAKTRAKSANALARAEEDWLAASAVLEQEIA